MHHEDGSVSVFSQVCNELEGWPNNYHTSDQTLCATDTVPHRVGGHMRTPGRIADPLTQKTDIESGHPTFTHHFYLQVNNILIQYYCMLVGY